MFKIILVVICIVHPLLLGLVMGDIPELNKIYFIKSSSDNSYLKAYDDQVPCRRSSRVLTTMDMSNILAMKWKYNWEFQMLIPSLFFKHNEFYEYLPPPSCTPAAHGRDILPLGHDTYQIKSRYTGLCLENYGIDTQVGWWTCGSSTHNQQWKFEETFAD